MTYGIDNAGELSHPGQKSATVAVGQAVAENRGIKLHGFIGTDEQRSALVESHLHPASGGRYNNLTFEHSVTRPDLALLTVFISRKGYAFNRNDITDNFGFICHGELRTDVLDVT